MNSMKHKLLLSVAFVFFITGNIFTQESVNLVIRDKDVTKFQKVKLYLNILDKDGKPILKIDSTNISITEKETGKKEIPRVQNFYASDEPMAILFSIDASNSMDGPPLNNVKEGILKIVSDLRKDDKIGIAYFHDDFFKQASFDTDRDVLRNNITALKTGGSSTELYKGAIESIKWLKSLPEPRRKILVLISDGEDNGTAYKLEDVLNEVKSSGITVFTIGSTAVDLGFLINMEKIAQSSNDGKYYKITGPEDIKANIPTIYDRIKQEYIISYYSYAKTNTSINASLNININNQQYTSDFSYNSPSEIVENAPSISFWKTKEFLFGSIGGGIIIIVLTVFMFINISKKKQYKQEKEEERRIREEESKENEEKFNRFKEEYDKLLDSLENQHSVSESDKEHIMLLEKQVQEAGSVLGTGLPKIDIKRRTMILEKGSFPQPQFEQQVNLPKLIIKNGSKAGSSVTIGSGITTIGRTNASIIINDETVSRQHARIYLVDGKYVIEDINSTNGTFVNNRKITKAFLKTSDIIRTGNIEMLFSN